MLSPMDKQWVLYVLLLSLINVWIAGTIFFLSIEEPLHIIFTDGSLVVFCIVSVWLTFAGFRQELMRGREERPRGARFQPGAESRFWQYYDFHMAASVVVTAIGSSAYTAFLLAGHDIPDAHRIVVSIAAVAVGAGMSRRFIVLTHEAGMVADTEPAPRLEPETP